MLGARVQKQGAGSGAPTDCQAVSLIPHRVFDSAIPPPPLLPFLTLLIHLPLVLQRYLVGISLASVSLATELKHDSKLGNLHLFWTEQIK